MAEMNKICDGSGDDQYRFGIVSLKGFHPLSNFSLTYKCEVRAGRESGFVCNITLFNGDDLG